VNGPESKSLRDRRESPPPNEVFVKTTLKSGIVNRCFVISSPVLREARASEIFFPLVRGPCFGYHYAPLPGAHAPQKTAQVNYFRAFFASAGSCEASVAGERVRRASAPAGTT
jgi:hypothetical protein